MADARVETSRWHAAGYVLSDEARRVLEVLVEAGASREVLEVTLTPPEIAQRAGLEAAQVDTALVMLQAHGANPEVPGVIEAVGPHRWRLSRVVEPTVGSTRAEQLEPGAPAIRDTRPHAATQPGVPMPADRSVPADRHVPRRDVPVQPTQPAPAPAAPTPAVPPSARPSGG